MRYTLSESYFARQRAIVRWKYFFVSVLALFIAVVAQQQYFPYASAVGVAAILSAAVACYLLWTQQRRAAKKASLTWLELTENALVYGYETGQTQIYLKSIKSAVLGMQAWPVLTLTLKDGSHISLQGFGGIEKVEIAISQALMSNQALKRIDPT
jgi:hypothetical protein